MTKLPIKTRRNSLAKIVHSMPGAGAHRKTRKALRRAATVALQGEIEDGGVKMQRPKTTKDH